MKRILLIVFLATVAANTSTVMARTSDSKKEKATAVVQSSSDSKLTHAQQLISRVYEIQKMDRSNLTMKQKTDLKNELLTIKQKLEKDPVVLVFSGAGVVLLIVLLVLLL